MTKATQARKVIIDACDFIVWFFPNVFRISAFSERCIFTPPDDILNRV